MTPKQAKDFIEKEFKASVFTDTVGDKIDERLFLELLSAVEHLIPFSEGKQNENLCRFLWSGCRKFDRWFTPSPYVVPSEYEGYLARFAAALVKADRGVNDNAAIFDLHSVRNRLYRKFNGRPLPLNTEDASVLDDLRKKVASIRSPAATIKVEEFNRERILIGELLRALEESDLRTRCKIILPYPLLRKSYSFRVISDDIEVGGTLSPSFRSPAELMVKGMAPTVMVARGPTRWQFGATEIELTFASLIDHSSKVDPLQMPNQPPPVEGWPNIFRVVFNFIYELSWRLRDHGAFVGVWVPSPADMGDIEYRITTARDKNINFIRKGNPALGLLGFLPDTAVEHIDLGEIAITPWHGRCRILAEQYLALGDTREALFWLNVGIESFLDQQMRALIKKTGASIDEGQLAGAPSYWDAAKSLVQGQFPDVAEQITWPDHVPHVSMFRRINFFTKHVPLKETARKITAAYSKIQRDRNALFHGQSEQPVTAERVREAVESFDWLIRNFALP